MCKVENILIDLVVNFIINIILLKHDKLNIKCFFSLPLKLLAVSTKLLTLSLYKIFSSLPNSSTDLISCLIISNNCRFGLLHGYFPYKFLIYIGFTTAHHTCPANSNSLAYKIPLTLDLYLNYPDLFFLL